MVVVAEAHMFVGVLPKAALVLVCIKCTLPPESQAFLNSTVHSHLLTFPSVFAAASACLCSPSISRKAVHTTTLSSPISAGQVTMKRARTGELQHFLKRTTVLLQLWSSLPTRAAGPPQDHQVQAVQKHMHRHMTIRNTTLTFLLLEGALEACALPGCRLH